MMKRYKVRSGFSKVEKHRKENQLTLGYKDLGRDKNS